ncbi:MAG: hypothetical protein J5685_10260 [Clostridiales bacterium]|jgi:hypothetical protein|nr:hypothetical protein [Clostridiales bacterium]
MDYDRQEILDKAAMAYEHAETTIMAMDGVFHNITGHDYDAGLTLAQFDMILQGVLLSVACADGTFDPVEQDFIKQFAMHGDLLEYIKQNSEISVDLTWDIIASLPEDLCSTLVEILPQVLDEQCSSFVYPLAAVDFSYSQYGGVETTPGDFLRSIESDMIKIAGLLAFVDEEGTEDEICAAVAMIYELEGKHWRELLSGRSLGPGQYPNSSIQ